jgi:hypothetical protein
MGGRLWLVRRSDGFGHFALRDGELEKWDGEMGGTAISAVRVNCLKYCFGAKGIRMDIFELVCWLPEPMDVYL